uniref:Putative ryanodine receptor, RyR, domain containing protein n=1 Tax=viral metagenome TaxID=1070528 RepID=A0A6H1ZAC1_9ZZZZ
MLNENVREKLAVYAHDAWSGWMKYLFRKSAKNSDGTVTIPVWATERWMHQANTPYSKLSDDEKKSDLSEADQILALLKNMDFDCGTCEHCGWVHSGDKPCTVRRG